MRGSIVRAGAASLAIVGGLGLVSVPLATGAGAASSPLVAVPSSVTPTTDTITGSYSSPAMTVEVALAPSHQALLDATLANEYTPSSPTYHHWLSTGQFDARFAPSRATTTAVVAYLKSEGLSVDQSSSPFLIRATGSSARVSGAFHTSLANYRDRRGHRYFANRTAVRLPGTISSAVYGVVGLTNTALHSTQVERVRATPANHGPGQGSSCETPYVTSDQLSAAVNDGTSFPYGYGAGPGCSGLTPSQTNALYGAPQVGPRGQGAGVTIAVFELSAYQQSDITTWAHTLYGPRYNPTIKDKIVDGGPLNPICPAGDTCPAEYNGYSGDVEVAADIEMQLSMAPAVQKLIVYNAPNDYTGQTSLDEYAQIAQDNTASVISSSWGVCENDAGTAYVEAENTVFKQMAAQGQSLFSSSGDTGAFDCLRGDGTTIANTDDPSSQPWVTSVGGTSFADINPGQNPYPRYPALGESVWNVDNLCNANDNVLQQAAFFWCGATGAGGGGSSQYWGRPSYQQGPGVLNRSTSFGNGSTQCALARVGAACREVPDVSANADPYTGPAEYCTGNANTPNSACATFTSTVPGWFQIGGTSLSSPLWSGVIADRNSYTGRRTGSANVFLYGLFNQGPGRYFNDQTGFGQVAKNNGLFPTTPAFDLATGMGSPKMAAIIEAPSRW